MTPLQALLARIARAAGVAVCIEFAVAVAAIAYLGVHLAPIVFGTTSAPLDLHFDAECRGAAAETACNVSTIRLTAGRIRLATDVAASRLTLRVSPLPLAAVARTLLVRISEPQDGVELTRSRSDGVATPIVKVERGVRTIAPLAGPPSEIGELALAPVAGRPDARIVVDEIAFYHSSDGLLTDVRTPFPWIPAQLYYPTIVARAVLPICIFTAFAAFVVPASMLKRIGPILLGAICFAFCLLDLVILYSPYGQGDLRVFYAAGPLQEPVGNTLNEGLWLASRFLDGQGLTVMPHMVPWERMPGYALFCAAAGLVFGHASLVDLALSTVLLQVIFYSVAVGLFSAAAGLVWPPAIVWTVSLLITLLPKQLGYTQADSIIAPIALMVSSALCVRLNYADSGRHAPWRVDLLVHLAFASWFLMRPDVLPGWVIVSLILHWRSGWRLAIPVALVLAIGLGWGAYKAGYTHEFSPTTSSTGASLMCGLSEVPNRFALSCTDETYFAWIQSRTSLGPKSLAANNFATREVVKFWLTYPGHLVIMLNHKMMMGLDGHFWPGFRTDLQRGTDLQRVVSRALARPVLTLAMLTIIALCLAVGYRRRHIVLLGWPIFFDAPLFWVTFSSLGRFYSAVPIALIVCAVPPIFDPSFYARASARPWRMAAVLTAMILFSVFAWRFDAWLIRNDSFHYWTPLLDPAKSALTRFQ